MAAGPFWSVPRLAADLVVWVLAAYGAHRIGAAWATIAAAAFIGAVPMHDLLVHGHEGVHRHLARRRGVNELGTWLTHAMIGISGVAYRRFHLAHHRWAQTERDPEYHLLRRVARGAPGWSYLAIPLLAHAYVNTYPLRTRATRRVLWLVARDAAGIVLLHASLALGLGPRAYLTFVVAPTFTSLAAVVVLRSLCEHHATPAGNAWTNTRTMNAGRVLDLLWSNTGYHLEHHLFPFVPFHRLPAVRAELEPEMQRRGSAIDHGFWGPALRLLVHRTHFEAGRPAEVSPRTAFVDAGSLGFRMKVRWFRDLLAHPAARRHLWSLYYAGEAYVELHPDGVFISRLPAPLGAQLCRQLQDETRHAKVFRRLLADEGGAPEALPPREDVGFYLLTHVMPEICAELGGTTPFTPELTRGYMAFLHVLELRSLGDLYALIRAAEIRGEIALAADLRAILRDERFHASYTHRAVMRNATDAQQGWAVLDAARRAERRHYTATLLAILRRFEALGARPDALAGRLRWTAMRALATVGLAVPLLPLFRALPAHFANE
jgi:fatty acid desaturase